MLPTLLLGIALLIALILIGRWFATASPRSVLKTLAWVGGGILASSALFLLATGRMGLAMAALAGLTPWVFRALRAHALYRMTRGMFGAAGGGAGAAPKTSEVRTAILHMVLDHDSGGLDGEVVDGPLRGRRLSDLDFAEAAQLWRMAAADPQSAQLLDAWLRRERAEWLERLEEGGAQGGRTASPPPPGGMTREEAYEILGLGPGAGPEEVKAAHRRLMTRFHPDRGGSNWLAARINQAKDLLINS